MESQRQLKFGRLIQKDLAGLFQQEFKSLLEGAFLTISHVKVSPDLGVANVYCSFLMAKNEAALMETLAENTKAIRMELGKKIRHQVRVIPELRFFIDDTAAEALRIQTLLDGLNIPPSEEGNTSAFSK